MTSVVDQTDPRLRAFNARLSRRLELYAGLPFDDDLFRRMKKAVDRVRANADLDLPPLVPFLLRGAKVVEVFRADAEPAAIAQTIAYVMERYGASVDDVLWALERAYPKHARGNLN
jgi:hypothetical protein